MNPFFIAAVASSGGGPTFLTEQEIAALAVSPSTVSDLILLGDSRLAAQQDVMIANSPEIIYSGCHGASFNAYTFGTGHTSAQGSYGGGFNRQPTSPYIGGIATWAPQNVWESEFTGENMSGGELLTRIAYGGPNLPDSFPRLYDRVIALGVASQVRAHVWGGAHGLSGDPAVRLWFRPIDNTTTAAAGSLTSTLVSDTTTPGYSEMVVDVPDSYDWATHIVDGLSIDVHTPSPDVTADGVIFAFANMPWWEMDAPGLVVHSWSFGGRSIEGFLPADNGLAAPAGYDVTIWNNYVPLLGDRPKLFWIDLGTNNAAGNSQAQHAAKLEMLIGLIRNGTPAASILLTSAFEHSTSGTNPYWRAAAADVAAAMVDQGVVYIDTCGLLPSYADGDASEIYGDAVHYNDIGTAIRASIVSNELALIGEGIDPSTWGLEWEWDPGLRSKVTMDTGVSEVADTFSGDRLVQSTAANQPSRLLHSANWGLMTALGLDGSNDVMQLSGSDVPAAEQRFLHDCTIDWEIVFHARMLTGAASGSMLLGTTATLAGVGLSVIYRGTQELRVRIHTTGGTVIAQVDLPAGSFILDTVQLVRVKFTASTQTLSAQIDEGTAVTGVVSGAPNLGDASGALAVGGWPGSNLSLAEIGYLSVGKTIADEATRAKQVRHFEIRTNRILP